MTKQAPEYYDPMQISDLLFKFEKISTDDEALAFADAYGFLGIQGHALKIGDPMSLVEDLQDLKSATLACAEPLSYWLDQTASLRLALEAWRAFEARDHSTIIRMFMPRLPGLDPRLATFERAKQWFIGFLNVQLLSGTESFLSLDHQGNPKPHTTPRSLMSCFWLQVSHIVSGIKQIRPCASCGEWMDITQNHSNKRLHPECSLRERMRRYRSRKKL